MLRKVLVTGATGFIGSYVVPALLERGMEVIASSVHKEKAQKYTWFDRVIYIPFELSDFDPHTDYYSYFQEPGAVIHLAWEGLPNYTSLFHFEENLPRHYAFLKNLVANGCRDLTVTGTCFEYGMQEGMLSEDMSSFPDNPYGLAKYCLSRFLAELQKHHDFSLKWVRLFYMYGKGQSPKSLFSQLETAIANNDEMFNMSGGEQIRDYLPVEEVAAGIVSVALQQKIQGIINCCSGQPITVKKLVQDFLAIRNASLKLNLGYYPYPTYEPMRFWGDNKKIQTILHE